MNEQDYIKGFNYGYAFKGTKPLLFETVSKGLVDDNDFRTGFRDGGKQYDHELAKEQLKERRGNDQQDHEQERDR